MDFLRPRLCAATAVFMVALFAFQFAVLPALPSPDGRGGTGHWEVSAESPFPTNFVQIYMKENLELGAERPTSENQALKTKVPNSFVPRGPLGRLGTNVEQYVGTWKSNPIKQQIVTAGRITFKLWVWNDGGRTGTFNLTMFKNDDISNIVATVTFSGVSINSNPSFVQQTVPLTLNNTDLMPRDELSLRIDATVNGGCYIMYGSTDRDSGFILQTDALSINKLEANTKGFEMHYNDAFGVTPHSMIFYAEVDNKPLNGQELSMMEISLHMLDVVVRWPFPLDAELEHEFVVAASYGGDYSTNVSLMVAKFVKGYVDEGLLPGVDNAAEQIILLLAGLLTTIIVLAVAYAKLKARKLNRTKERLELLRRRNEYIAAGILPPNATLRDAEKVLARYGKKKEKPPGLLDRFTKKKAGPDSGAGEEPAPAPAAAAPPAAGRGTAAFRMAQTPRRTTSGAAFTMELDDEDEDEGEEEVEILEAVELEPVEG